MADDTLFFGYHPPFAENVLKLFFQGIGIIAWICFLIFLLLKVVDCMRGNTLSSQNTVYEGVRITLNIILFDKNTHGGIVPAEFLRSGQKFD